MLVTERTLAHICQFDGALGACVHEPIAALRVELCGCNDFGQLLHIRRLNIDDVEALILNIEIPEVDPEVITADECLSVAVDRDAIDVVGVGISIRASRDGSYDGIVMRQARELQIPSFLEM